MWNLATQSAVVAIIISAATTAALLLRSRRSLHVRFAGFALSAGAYYITALIAILVKNNNYVTSMSIVSGGVVVIFTASFFDALIGDAGLVGKKRRQKTYLAGLAIILIGITPLSQIAWVRVLVFCSTVFLFAVRARLLSKRAEEVESSADRTRLRYLAYIGAFTVLAFCLDALAHLQWNVPALGGFAVAFYLYFISQALLVSRLLDLHELLGKALVFSCLALILALVYGVLVMWVDSHPGLFLFNTLIASSLILILFEPLKSFLEEQTTRLFFREHITFARDLRRAARTLVTFVELQPAIEFVLDQIYDNKRATHTSVYILDAEGTGFVLQGYRGPAPTQGMEGKRHPVLFRYVLEGQKPILRESVQRRLLQQRAKQTGALLKNENTDLSYAEDQALIEDLATIHSELVIPLRSVGNVTGFLSLKDERLTEAYAQDEITALVQLGEQLAITIQNSRIFDTLKEKDRLAALGEMSAGLAHEIRNPLAAIKGAAQALDPSKVSSDERELLQIMVDEVNRLNKVVSEFLNYAKPFRGTFAPLNLNDAVTRTLQLLEHDTSKEIDLRVDLEADLPDISGDSEQLRQVLINLVLNARDAIPPQGTLRVSTRATDRSRSHVELRVQDTGPGISQKVRDKIFIPFFTTKQRGTGLGLALCQRIVRDHGGSIDVRSVLGKGSTFIVKLPTSQTLALHSTQEPLGATQPWPN